MAGTSADMTALLRTGLRSSLTHLRLMTAQATCWAVFFMPGCPLIQSKCREPQPASKVYTYGPVCGL